MKKVELILGTVPIAIGLILFSCSKNEENLSQVKTGGDDNFVVEGMANAIGENINPTALEKGMKIGGCYTAGIPKNDVKSVEGVKDKSGKVVFYVVNYEKGGYVILSADKRTTPILAFSDKGKFDPNDENMNGGVVWWMNNIAGDIIGLRESKAKQSEQAKAEWGRVMPRSKLSNPCKYKPNSRECKEMGGPDGAKENGVCTDSYEQKGPLLKTTWGQLGEYNDLLPGNCVRNGRKDQYPAGCVIISSAQVMNYHKFPKNIKFGNNIKDIQKLIKFVFDKLDPDDKCGGTEANTCKDLPDFFKGLGYSYCKCDDINTDAILREIREGRPVIMSGRTKEDWLGLIPRGEGHSWVCDGFESSEIHSDDCMQGWGILRLHMNWGWEGIEDGWFSFNDYPTKNGNFKEENKILIVIP